MSLFDPDQLISDIFAENGRLASVFGPGYSRREQQASASLAVARAMSRERGVMLQAMTGTGKSIGYAVPAAKLATTTRDDGSKRRVLIATANKSLQRQLVDKDGPIISQLFPGVSVRHLQGIGNYLCLKELESAAGPVLGMSREERDAINSIEAWARETVTGDRSELDDVPGQVWFRYSTSASQCRGEKCSQAAECFYERAKNLASEASIVVVSYALMLSVAAASKRLINPQTGEPMDSKFLSRFDYLICDEGHELADEARERLGLSVFIPRILGAARYARGLKPGLETTTRGVFNELDRRLRASREDVLRLRSPGDFSSGPIVRALEAISAEYARMVPNVQDPGFKRDLKNAQGEIVQIVDDLESFETLKGPGGAIYFAERGSRGEIGLRAILLRPGKELRSSLFRYFAGSRGLRVAIVSATLQTGRALGSSFLGRGDELDRSFSFQARELGFKPEGDSPGDRIGLLSVDSPFDWAGRVRLYVPGADDLVSPAERELWPDAAPRLAASLISDIDGPVLILCTSHNMVQRFATELRRWEISVGVQHKGQSRDGVVKAFRDGRFQVLIGTTGLGTGLDCPGLSAVIIDRIPWPRRGDPLQTALEEADGKASFRLNYLPRALTTTAQWMGRLMRRSSDRGLVVMLDRRMVEGRYKADFSRVKPPIKLFRSVRSIGHHWNRLKKLDQGT